jgi:signal recognition particle receptor subunit beta
MYNNDEKDKSSTLAKIANSDKTKKTVVGIASWLWELFGKDVEVILVNKMHKAFKSVLNNRDILIFGNKQVGKSSLIQYLQTQKPFVVSKNGQKEILNPTTEVVALIGKKLQISPTSSAKVKFDVPGDRNLRFMWMEVLEEVNPAGIIYMVDGRKSDRELEAELEELFTDILDKYQSSSNLGAIAIFLNYCDYWASTNKRQVIHAKTTNVKNFIINRIDNPEYGLFNRLEVGVYETQLSPKLNDWKEVEGALQEFSGLLTKAGK